MQHSSANIPILHQAFIQADLHMSPFSSAARSHFNLKTENMMTQDVCGFFFLVDNDIFSAGELVKTKTRPQMLLRMMA